MKADLKVLFICLLAAFMLLGPSMPQGEPIIASGQDGTGGQIVFEFDDDLADGGDFNPALMIAYGAGPGNGNKGLSVPANSHFKTDFRIHHFLPDTRGSPAADI